MHPNLIDDLIVLDSFQTFDGMVYRLVKTADNRYQVRKNYTIYFTTARYELAAEKFQQIKNVLRQDHMIKI